MRILSIALLLPLFISGAGCSLMQTNPDGTQSVDPAKVEAVDNVIAVVEPVGQTLTALSVVNPALGVIGGLLVGIAGAWKKMKPEIETAKTEADIASSAGVATAQAIEEFKTKFPDEWGKLEAFFTKYHGQTVENFYRALRDLPPKV